MASSASLSDKGDGTDLQSQQIVHGADDDVDGGGAARLGSQVVLEI